MSLVTKLGNAQQVRDRSEWRGPCVREWRMGAGMFDAGSEFRAIAIAPDFGADAQSGTKKCPASDLNNPWQGG